MKVIKLGYEIKTIVDEFLAQHDRPASWSICLRAPSPFLHMNLSTKDLTSGFSQEGPSPQSLSGMKRYCTKQHSESYPDRSRYLFGRRRRKTSGSAMKEDHNS